MFGLFKFFQNRRNIKALKNMPAEEEVRTKAFDKGFRCPKCGKALRIVEAKNGNFFFGCTGYPDCVFISYKEKELPIYPNVARSGAYYLYKYIPKNKYYNAFKWDVFYSKKIIDFELEDTAAITYFAKALILAIEVICPQSERVGLIPIPSSKAGKHGAMERCIRIMQLKSFEHNHKPELVNLTGLIKRDKTVESSRGVEAPNKYEHADSITIDASKNSYGCDTYIYLMTLLETVLLVMYAKISFVKLDMKM